MPLFIHTMASERGIPSTFDSPVTHRCAARIVYRSVCYCVYLYFSHRSVFHIRPPPQPPPPTPTPPRPLQAVRYTACFKPLFKKLPEQTVPHINLHVIELGNTGSSKSGGKMYHGVGIKRLISVCCLRLSVCLSVRCKPGTSAI